MTWSNQFDVMLKLRCYGCSENSIYGDVFRYTRTDLIDEARALGWKEIPVMNGVRQWHCANCLRRMIHEKFEKTERMAEKNEGRTERPY